MGSEPIENDGHHSGDRLGVRLFRAFDRYETAHRAVVAPKLNGYRMGAAMLPPSTRAGIATRNTFAHAMRAASALRRPALRREKASA